MMSLAGKTGALAAGFSRSPDWCGSQRSVGWLMGISPGLGPCVTVALPVPSAQTMPNAHLTALISISLLANIIVLFYCIFITKVGTCIHSFITSLVPLVRLRKSYPTASIRGPD